MASGYEFADEGERDRPVNERKLMVATLLSAFYQIFFGDRGTKKRLLMYHSVGGKVPGDLAGIYSISEDRFRLQVDWLAEKRSGKVIGLERLLEDESGGVAITFDDGFADTLKTAAPILVERGLPFTVFVTPGFVRSGDPTYLSLGELRELARLPSVTIGAHGNTHRAMVYCEDAQLREELEDSKKWLEDALGQSVQTMSYPYGGVDRRVRDAAERAGYRWAACSQFGVYRAGADHFLVPRTDIWSADGLGRFQQKLCGGWDWMRWRKHSEPPKEKEMTCK